ncbi:MAG: SNF2-related protein, partial [Myxococcota bacterium]|nr:SNF2-related protein [Myxococcota bacterium]
MHNRDRGQLSFEEGREALVVLAHHAERRGAAGLSRRLGQRALRATFGADFALAEDALDELLRRLAAARTGELVVRATAPRRFLVGTRELPAQSEAVWVGDRETLESSCSCRDFGRSALGLCQHALAVWLAPDAELGADALPPLPALRWDPIRPLTGPGDYLARIWFDPRAALRRDSTLFATAPHGSPMDLARISGPARLATVEALLAVIDQQPAIAEPAVRPLLERERATLQRTGPPPDGVALERMLRGLKQELFPYQREGVTRFLAAGRLLLADDMGLGKTAQAIASCHALFATGRARRGLVVLPAPLKAQWEREWYAFTDIPAIAVGGPPARRASQYAYCEAGVLLVNYEQLVRDLPAIRAFAPDVVILDEAQRIKNSATRTAGLVKQIAAPWRLVLTGTPIENRLEELASIVEWVDEHALEPRWRLASWHSMRADGRRGVVGARNLDTLRARLAPVMLRRVRRDVLAQLPRRRDWRIPVALSVGQLAPHYELDAPIARLVQQGKRRPLTHAEFLRLMTLLTQQRLVCNGLALYEFEAVWPTLELGRDRREELLEVLASPKLRELRDQLFDLVVTQGRKVVVFSQCAACSSSRRGRARTCSRRPVRAPCSSAARRRCAAGPRTWSPSTKIPRCRCCSRPTPAGLGSTCSEPRAAASTSSCRGILRSSSSGSGGSTGWGRSGRWTCTISSPSAGSRRASLRSWATSAHCSPGCSTAPRMRSRSPRRARSSRASRMSSIWTPNSWHARVRGPVRRPDHHHRRCRVAHRRPHSREPGSRPSSAANHRGTR